MVEPAGRNVEVGPDERPIYAARTVLLRTIAGEDVAEAAHALACAVLEGRPVALARMVLEGGPHAVRAAVELAGLVVATNMQGSTSNRDAG